MKNFKELFESYRKGEVTPAEKEYIEAEIEKNELINDYLLENDEDWDKEILGEKAIDVARLKKQTSRKIMRMTLIPIGAVVCVGLLLFYLIIPGIQAMYDRKYYNPTALVPLKVEGVPDDKVMFDFTVYADLFIPGYFVNKVDVVKTGLGKYDLAIDFASKFSYSNDTATIETLKINKGKNTAELEGFHDLTRLPYSFAEKAQPAVATYELSSANERKSMIQENIAELKKLPDSSIVSAYVTFKEDQTIKESLALMKPQNSEIDIAWLGIRNQTKNEQDKNRVILPIGLKVDNTVSYYTDQPVSTKKYPNIINDDRSEKPALLEKMFKSQVQYILDNPDILAITAGTNTQGYDQIKQLKAVQDYINKQGIQSYGGLVYGKPAELITLLQNEQIYSAHLEDARLALFAK